MGFKCRKGSYDQGNHLFHGPGTTPGAETQNFTSFGRISRISPPGAVPGQMLGGPTC